MTDPYFVLRIAHELQHNAKHHMRSYTFLRASDFENYEHIVPVIAAHEQVKADVANAQASQSSHDLTSQIIEITVINSVHGTFLDTLEDQIPDGQSNSRTTAVIRLKAPQYYFTDTQENTKRVLENVIAGDAKRLVAKFMNRERDGFVSEYIVIAEPGQR